MAQSHLIESNCTVPLGTSHTVSCSTGIRQRMRGFEQRAVSRQIEQTRCCGNELSSMKTLPKILLTLSALSFVASLTGPGSEVWFGILKPIGALSFVVAFIVHVVSKLDPEQYAADQRLARRVTAPARALKTIPLPS